MAKNRDAEVDPRFDPVFQRGYDPAEHGRSTHRQSASASSSASAAAARDVRPLTPTPKYHPHEPAITDAEDIDEAVRPDGTGDVVVVTPDDDLDEVAPPRTNPFRLLLLLASIAAVGGAALLFWRRLEEDPYGGGYGPDVASTFAYQFVDALMVPLLTGGLIGFCLWLALGALRKRDDG